MNIFILSSFWVLMTCYAKEDVIIADNSPLAWMIVKQLDRIEAVQKELQKQISSCQMQQSDSVKSKLAEMDKQIENLQNWQIVNQNNNSPAFTATFQDGAFTPLTGGQVLKFDTVLLNRQHGYDPSTGLYTIPWSGVYLVTCTVRSYAGKHLHVILYKNENKLLWAYGRDSNTGSLAAVLMLEKGDRLCIKSDPLNNNNNNEVVQTFGTSMFSVVYISK